MNFDQGDETVYDPKTVLMVCQLIPTAHNLLQKI